MGKLSFEILARLVAEKREEKGWTQQDLGERTGINRQQIGRLEKKEFVPSLPQIERLCEELQFQFEDLLTQNNNEDVFVALSGKADTDAEKAGMKKMISMMLCLRKHDVLRMKLHG